MSPLDGGEARSLVNEITNYAHVAQLHADTMRMALDWANARCNAQFEMREVVGPCRKHDLVAVRHWMSWRLRSACRWSFPKIGKALGNRDHATIMHGVEKLNSSMGLPRNWPADEWPRWNADRIGRDIHEIVQRIEKGDHLEAIATQYHCTVSEIGRACRIAGFDISTLRELGKLSRSGMKHFAADAACWGHDL